MHDAGTRNIDDVRHMVQQGIEQRAVGMTGSRMHHQTRRLVDDEDLVVFIDDVELDVLSNPFTLGLLLGNQLENSATMHDVAGAQYASVHSQAAVLDPGGKARARVLSE